MRIVPGANKITVFALKEIKRQKIKIKDIEKRSGVSRSAMLSWRLYGAEPSVGNITALLNALGYDLEIKKMGRI
jgi:transcriptional regulator with XRE-family HTH domain